MVMDRAGFVEALATSPLSPHEAFVVFDEARCRCAALLRLHYQVITQVRAAVSTAARVPSARVQRLQLHGPRL